MKCTQHRKRQIQHLDIEHFRNILLAKRENILKEMETLSKNIAREQQSDQLIWHSFAHHRPEKRCPVTEREINSILYEQAKQYLNKLNAALERIDNGTYGICEKSGTQIPVRQLEAVPHRRFCAKVTCRGISSFHNSEH